jgi:hypothetical protein
MLWAPLLARTKARPPHYAMSGSEVRKNESVTTNSCKKAPPKHNLDQLQVDDCHAIQRPTTICAKKWHPSSPMASQHTDEEEVVEV